MFRGKVRWLLEPLGLVGTVTAAQWFTWDGGREGITSGPWRTLFPP